jgi:hypothetical protein
MFVCVCECMCLHVVCGMWCVLVSGEMCKLQDIAADDRTIMERTGGT